jgi:hypothetical protein
LRARLRFFVKTDQIRRREHSRNSGDRKFKAD